MGHVDIPIIIFVLDDLYLSTMVDKLF